jgi:alkylation response protein AidB-like acyl-CoA dehydrogenase
MNEIVRNVDGSLAPKATQSLLSDTLLETFGARAEIYDRENRFFDEDLADLSAVGYLTLAVPSEAGGQGFSLPEVVREQARLAYRAPATALAINMHLYWTGAAAYLWQKGDRSLEWIFREALAGKIFAAGHGEPGNDLGLAHSTTVAEPLGGGSYRFTGRKVFTSLSPAWDWLGLHGLDASDPAAPKIVHAFIREDPGHRTVQTWDALGVRATRSDDTVLEGVVAQAPYVSRVLPAGPPVDPFVDGIFSSAIPPIAAVYYGIARRAFDLAVASADSYCGSFVALPEE